MIQVYFVSSLCFVLTLVLPFPGKELKFPGSPQSFPSGSDKKNPSAMQETYIRSLGWEEPLEKGMATHSSILTWRIPWTEEPGGLQSMSSHLAEEGVSLSP